MPNGKGYKEKPDSKFQPGKPGGYTPNLNGSSAAGGGIHDFNLKGKVTNTMGSDYHDTGRSNSGLHGNFAEKDASMEYLRGRNKEGIRVKNYGGTNTGAELRVGTGTTAYNSSPIPEVYKPATSQGHVDPNAVQYKTAQKDRNIPMAPDYVQKTESNKTMKPIAKHVKEKE